MARSKAPRASRRVQVADVLAEEDLPADGDGHAVLEMTADRQHRRQVRADQHGQRGVASGPAQHALAAARQPHHRIVAGPGDGAVVHQEDVGDAV